MRTFFCFSFAQPTLGEAGTTGDADDSARAPAAIARVRTFFCFSFAQPTLGEAGTTGDADDSARGERSPFKVYFSSLFWMGRERVTSATAGGWVQNLKSLKISLFPLFCPYVTLPS